MTTITYEEQQLMALYNSAGTRTGLIAALREMRATPIVMWKPP